MLLRRALVLCTLIALACVASSAFTPPKHQEITDRAINALYSFWVPRPGMQGYWFSTSAIYEITDANRSQDEGDCSKMHSDDDWPAFPCGLEIALEIAEIQGPAHHFDDELFDASNDYIKTSRAKAISALKVGQYRLARKNIGWVLHTLQDFYSHSNWVETGNEGLEHRIVNADFKSGYPLVAAPNDKTCDILGHVLTAPDTPLTTGFFGENLPDMGPDKCKHGRVLTGGLHKDFPTRSGHEQAAFLAYCHTMRFMMDILEDKSLTPAMLLGMMEKGPVPPQLSRESIGCTDDMMFPPRLSFTKIQNANSVSGNLTLSATATDETGVAGVKYLLDGVQIGSEVTKSPYTYVWDSKSAPSGLHTVMAVARDAAGNWNAASQTIVVSNATVDCPGAVTPHTHDPRWLDVDANKWNSTGLVLKPGQQIRVTVMPGAQIVWRRGLLGGGATAPAQGDPRVNPGNTMFWLDPQIKGVAIGALIGGLWDEQVLAPAEDDQPVGYFPIYNGGSFTMNQGGRLFLGINDGSFANNDGCFQVQIQVVK